MRRMLGILVAAVLTVPAGMSAQEPGARRPMPRGEMHFQFLLEQRDALGLTAEQIAKLEQIHQKVEQENRPLMEKLHALHGGKSSAHAHTEMTEEQRKERREKMRVERQKRAEMTQAQRAARREKMKERREQREELSEEEREARRERMKELRPLMEEMRENHREAMEAVKEVLTDEQEAKLREMHGSRQHHKGHQPAEPAATHH